MEISVHPHIRKTCKYLRTFLFIGSCITILIFLFLTSIYLFAKILGPPPLSVPESTIYYAEDGTVIGETSNGEKRYWVELDEISPLLIQATIAIEDQRFYSHIGFDVKRIFGAVVADVKAMAKVQGASTISQQYARNLFLNHDKTWKRKVREAFYTIRLEANYSKKEILEGYLNTIYFGHGAYGVEAASRYYFGKNASDLNLAEATLLASIPKGPNIFSPFISWEQAKKRQKLVLAKMVDNKMITKKEAEQAYHEKIQLIGAHTNQEINIAPYFQDVVRSLLKNRIGLDDRTIALGGLKIYTTLDPHLQKIAEEKMNANIRNGSTIQAALVVMDPKTGFVKALIGGRDYEKSSYNRAVQAVRQPGSTIKPILYYAALEHGFTPSSTLRSEETTFYYDDGRKQYTPHNFNHKYAEGNLTMAQALALSDNVYAVKTHLFLGMETLVNYVKKFGISSKQEPVPSLALGTSGVRVIEMANAYSMFANGGKEIQPQFITKVVDREGNVIYKYQKEGKQVLDPKFVFVMSHMMMGMFDKKLNGYTTVTGNSIIEKVQRIYAGKSGSTNTDSWMIGFTPELVTAVWTGYDHNKKITSTLEKSYAKNIWIDFMESALAGKPIKTFQPPDGVVGVHVDPKSGLLATKNCPVSRLTYFIEHTEPTEYCLEHLPKSNHESIEKKKKEKTPWYERWFDWFNGKVE